MQAFNIVLHVENENQFSLFLFSHQSMILDIINFNVPTRFSNHLCDFALN